MGNVPTNEWANEKSGHKQNRGVHITHTKDIPRAPRSGDQGVCSMGALCSGEIQKLLEINSSFFFSFKGQAGCVFVATHLGPSEGRVVQTGIT